jgi:DNA-binding LacI/PurR family transcriptional regulator
LTNKIDETMPVQPLDNTRRIRPTQASQRAAIERVERELIAMCDSVPPGTRVPSHVELMAQFHASERTILAALETLRHDGRIVRRPGAGTFVSDKRGNAGHVVRHPDGAAPIVVVYRPDNSFFTRCANMLHQQSEALDIPVLCYLLGPEDTSGLNRIKSLPRALGYIVLGAQLMPIAHQLQETGRRTVIMTSPPLDTDPGLPCIHVDNEQGGYLATRHLIDLGHRSIAFAMVDSHPERSARWIGHRIAIREAERAGMQITSSVLLLSAMDDWRDDIEAPARFFRTPGAPTGLTVWNDRLAISLLTMLLRAGIKVPDEVSLVGYDNLLDGAQVSPSLTTIDQALSEQVQDAIDLLKQDEEPSRSLEILTPPTLIQRESSGPPHNMDGLERGRSYRQEGT